MSRILHISNDYFYTEVYDNLLTALSALGHKQTMYSTLKKGAEIDYSGVLKPYEILAPEILTKPYNLFFHRRIDRCYKYLKEHLNLSDFDICHAHFLYADGSIALRVKEEFGIPYIVSVRNTDYRFYFRYFFHLRRQATSVISNAEKIVFKSPGYVDIFKNHFKIPESKIVTIPNGTHKFWVENMAEKPRSLIAGQPVKFLYVGELSKNKNIVKTINVLGHLKKSLPLTYTVVGRPGDAYKDISALISRHSDWIQYLGHIGDKEQLKNIYREHDIFIMLSKYETFGLVYAEAMSQGLPVLYPVQQGIDGYYDEGKVGFHVDTDNLYDCRYKVNFIVENYKSFSREAIEAAKKLNWSVIASRKSEIYHGIIKK